MATEVLRKRQYTWEELSSGASDPDNLKLSEDEFLHQLLRAINASLRDAALGLACNDFDSIDIDGDGLISPKEHKAFFYGNGIPTEKSGDVFKVIDKDGDGMISRDEFVQGHIDFFFNEDENSPYTCFMGPLVE